MTMSMCIILIYRLITILNIVNISNGNFNLSKYKYEVELSN